MTQSVVNYPPGEKPPVRQTDIESMLSERDAEDATSSLVEEAAVSVVEGGRVKKRKKRPRGDGEETGRQRAVREARESRPDRQEAVGAGEDDQEHDTVGAEEMSTAVVGAEGDDSVGVEDQELDNEFDAAPGESDVTVFDGDNIVPPDESDPALVDGITFGGEFEDGTDVPPGRPITRPRNGGEETVGTEETAVDIEAVGVEGGTQPVEPAPAKPKPRAKPKAKAAPAEAPPAPDPTDFPDTSGQTNVCNNLMDIYQKYRIGELHWIRVERLRPATVQGNPAKGLVGEIRCRVSENEFRHLVGDGQYTVQVYGPTGRTDAQGTPKIKALTKLIDVHVSGVGRTNLYVDFQQGKNMQAFGGSPMRPHAPPPTTGEASITRDMLGTVEKERQRTDRLTQERIDSERQRAESQVAVANQSSNQMVEMLKSELKASRDQVAEVSRRLEEVKNQPAAPTSADIAVKTLETVLTQQNNAPPSGPSSSELQQVHNNYQAQIQRDSAAHRDEITRLTDNHGRQMDEHRRNDRDGKLEAERRHKDELAELRSRHNEVVDRMERNFDQRLKDLESRHQLQLSSVEKDYQGRLDNERSRAANDLQVAQQMADIKAESLAAPLRQQVASLEDRLGQARSETEKTRTELANKDPIKEIARVRATAEELGMTQQANTDPQTAWERLADGLATVAGNVPAIAQSVFGSRAQEAQAMAHLATLQAQQRQQPPQPQHRALPPAQQQMIAQQQAAARQQQGTQGPPPGFAPGPQQQPGLRFGSGSPDVATPTAPIQPAPTMDQYGRPFQTAPSVPAGPKSAADSAETAPVAPAEPQPMQPAQQAAPQPPQAAQPANPASQMVVAAAQAAQEEEIDLQAHWPQILQVIPHLEGAFVGQIHPQQFLEHALGQMGVDQVLFVGSIDLDDILAMVEDQPESVSSPLLTSQGRQWLAEIWVLVDNLAELKQSGQLDQMMQQQPPGAPPGPAQLPGGGVQ